MQQSFHQPFVVAGLLALSWLFPLHAESVTLEPRKDNTLYQDDSGSLSNGRGPAIFAGINGKGEIRRALLAFDLGIIPPGSTIHSVTLGLTQSNTNDTNPQGRTISLHRVLRDWGEGASTTGNAGGGTGVAAASGDATWIHTFFPDQFWDASGGDFESAPSAAATIEGNGRYTVGPTGELTADVQSWVDNPESNFGWLILGDETNLRTAKRFNSRNAAAAETRPLMTVEFTAPPMPGVLEFETDRLSTFEDSAMVVIAVTRTQGSEGEVTVDYATGNGDAVPEVDYAPAAGTLVFGPGETRKTFSVALLDDDVFEGVESLEATLSAPTGGASLGERSTMVVTVDDPEDLTQALHFAQFGEGSGFVSEIILDSLDEANPTHARIFLRLDDGAPFPAILNGEQVSDGVLQVEVPAGGSVSLITGGMGAPRAGSAAVRSDRPLSGVILFGGDFGLAGVGAGAPLENGFIGPVRTISALGVNTGVALQNLEPTPTTVTFQLVDADGAVVAEATVDLPGDGHVAAFPSQLNFDPPVDFSDFRGTIRASSTGPIAAVMLQTRPGQFATLPVTPR